MLQFRESNLLTNSILPLDNNFLINVDEIMVEKLDGDNYLVREGNRRVTALKLIYAEYDKAGLLEQLDDKLYKQNIIYNRISTAKNNLIYQCVFKYVS